MTEFTEFTFPSKDGVHKCHASLWTPGDGPRAVVQIVHGVADYMGRYDHFARYLADHGFVVCGEDHLGHGRTVDDGKYGYFGKKDGWMLVTADVRQLRRLMGEKYPDVPYFLMGHSMGSFLARTYLIRYPGTVDAAVIMGTGQMPLPMLQAARALAEEECRRVGEDQVSPLVDKMAFGAYNKRFAPNRTEADWLSLSQANVDAYLADPLCGGTATVGLFREMLGGLGFIRRRENLRRMNLNTPVLFISGEQDPVGDMGRGVRRAYDSFRRAGVRDVSLRLYPELRHEILNEACGEEVFQDIYQWLTEKTPAAQGCAQAAESPR